MAGRKPTPTHLKLLRGNPGKRALNKREPKPARGIPKCPAHLSEHAKAAWKRVAQDLDRMGVLTLVDGMALELLVCAYGEWRDAADELTRLGAPTYAAESNTGATMYRPRPEVAIAHDAWRRVATMLREFGMTPSSRTKVQVPGDKNEDPLDAFLGKRNA